MSRTARHTRPAFTRHLVAAALTALLAACGGGGGGDDTRSPQDEPPPPPPPPAHFSLTLSGDKAVVQQGGSVTLTAQLQRDAGFSGAVQVQLSGLPSGVSAAPVTIAAGQSSAPIVLTAQPSAPHSLPTATTVMGSAGTDTASRPLTVTVRGIAGAVDTSFAGGVVSTPVDNGEDYANAVVTQADGKVIVAGSSATAGGTVISLVRYGRDGAIDTGFGSAGKVLTPFNTSAQAAALALQADGKILVVGHTVKGSSDQDFALLRYNADGSLDGGFGSGGKVSTDFGSASDRAFAIVVQPDGKIVLGGQTQSGAATSGLDFALARYTASGALDSGFGNGGKQVTAVAGGSAGDAIYALALQPVDGEQRLLAVGGEGDFMAARYRPDGTLDAGFGNAGRIAGLFGESLAPVIGAARALTVLPGGEAVVAGHLHHDFTVARLGPDGSMTPGFGPGGHGYLVQPVSSTNWDEATAIVRQADGKFIVGGWVYEGNSSSGNFAALRLNADGQLDSGFGTAGTVITRAAEGSKDDLGHALTLQADERVPTVRAIQAGEANGSNHDFALIRLWL